MPWNYRIMRHRADPHIANDEPFYAVHEVHYDKNGAVNGWTEDLVGCSGETVAELSKDIAWYLTALVKPVLDATTGQEIEPAQLLEDDIYAMIEPGSEIARQAVREHGAQALAQAIEARSGETRQRLDPKDESPVGNADAPDLSDPSPSEGITQ